MREAVQTANPIIFLKRLLIEPVPQGPVTLWTLDWAPALGWRSCGPRWLWWTWTLLTAPSARWTARMKRSVVVQQLQEVEPRSLSPAEGPGSWRAPVGTTEHSSYPEPYVVITQLC